MMNDVVRTISVNEISRIYRTTESRYRMGLIGRAKWLLNEVSGDLRSATNRAFERVWPHPQPCVFVRSLNYFRT